MSFPNSSPNPPPEPQSSYRPEHVELEIPTTAKGVVAYAEQILNFIDNGPEGLSADPGRGARIEALQGVIVVAMKKIQPLEITVELAHSTLPLQKQIEIMSEICRDDPAYDEKRIRGMLELVKEGGDTL